MRDPWGVAGVPDGPRDTRTHGKMGSPRPRRPTGLALNTVWEARDGAVEQCPVMANTETEW
jgi:hypothetical protein